MYNKVSKELFRQIYDIEAKEIPEGKLGVNEMHNSRTDFEPWDWCFPHINYALYGIFLKDQKEASMWRKAYHFYYKSAKQTLCQKLYDGVLLQCLSSKEAQEVLKEAHDDTCGAHQFGLKLWDRLKRLGYYWTKIISNSIAYTRRNRSCQFDNDSYINYQNTSIQQ